MNKSKQTIRAEMKAWRRQADQAELKTASKIILERLITSLDWSAVQSLHTYIPIPALNEIDTWPLLAFVWQNPRIITAIAPARQTGSETALRVSPTTRWRGVYPEDRRPLPASTQFDIIIVPTLAYDKAGNRLGWGGGFYDKFLASQAGATKIGLAYAASLVKSGLPAEPHDIKLDQIITEL